MNATYNAAMGTFKRAQGDITTLSRKFAALSRKVDFIDYLCRKCSIDREYYALWLNNSADFAELVVLYLSNETRAQITAELVHLEQLAC